jgi:hypothetical protein
VPVPSGGRGQDGPRDSALPHEIVGAVLAGASVSTTTRTPVAHRRPRGCGQPAQRWSKPPDDCDLTGGSGQVVAATPISLASYP